MVVESARIFQQTCRKARIGKSSIFPATSFGVAHFNADDRAAGLNGGSYNGILRHIRQTVSVEFEAFVSRCIRKRSQSRRRCAARWHLEHVKIRADAGRHCASETTLRRIYALSLANLARAATEMDQLWLYDNTKVGGPQKLRGIPFLLTERVGCGQQPCPV